MIMSAEKNILHTVLMCRIAFIVRNGKIRPQRKEVRTVIIDWETYSNTETNQNRAT